MVTSGCTVTGIKLRLVLTVVSQPPPPASLLLLNKHTQAGHQNPPNNNLTLLHQNAVTAAGERKTRLYSGDRPPLHFDVKVPFQLLHYVKNLQNVSDHSTLDGENVNPPCSATTTQ